MFSRRGGSYEAAADSGSLEELTRKLSGDLRKHIRKLDHHPPLSRGWLALIDSLLHISNIALMEHRLPREDDTATLWEGEELTVRFLLEEGKLNLCLRLMHEYKRKRRELDADAQVATRSAMEVDMEVSALNARMLVFEQSLTVLLKCAFEHAEPLQTVDMPELLEHCAEVLECASARPADTLELLRTQESAVPLYVLSVLKRLEVLDERRVCELFKACALVPRVLHFAAVHGEKLGAEGTEAIGQVLLLVLESEDYKTHKAHYLPPALQAPPALPTTGIVGAPTDAKANLVLLKALVLRSAEPDVKRKFAPLVREAEAIERLARLKADSL
ncbi:hypothetical protein T492DRAFT_914695 [Pavlovales sp. CCMP2436]|nr:hypothetical protein T492DRAFT_914695 [Pavlovales sp. CCMP2436]